MFSLRYSIIGGNMKECIKEMQLSPPVIQYGYSDVDVIDREFLLFQWCTGKSIAHLAREYSLAYHIMYRIIKSD
jgi:hypothetical protein